MPRHLITLSAIGCLLGSVIFLLTRQSFQLSIPTASSPSGTKEPFSLAAFYSNVPYTSTWQSWWHPQRPVQSWKEFIDGKWNLLYHLGGNGPWIEKVDGVVPGGIMVPEGCKVEQVHMMSRHAERYPTKNAGKRMIDLLVRIKQSNTLLKGDLDFVNDWEYFSTDPDKDLDQLTNTGPFAGVLEAFTTGVKLRTRYGHLLPSNKTHLWASDSQRVVNTAEYFSAGFFGLSWQDHAELHVIPETSDLGADTLTPGDTCLRYNTDLTKGHDYGINMLIKFRSTYLGAIGDRLEKQTPDIRFTDAELYSMQEMCGFETTVRGSSLWCDVFSHDEWMSFEYARDVIHYYRAGPGNPYGPAMGWLWLNATMDLLREGPRAGPFFFSFVHDGDIVPMLAALNLFPDDEDLPVTGFIPKDRTWKTSQMTPMGGRVIFERMACSATGEEESFYIRVNINDGIVPIPSCHNGPGSSCSLAKFEKLVEQRGREIGEFQEICGLRGSAPTRITFLHQ